MKSNSAIPLSSYQTSHSKPFKYSTHSRNNIFLQEVKTIIQNNLGNEQFGVEEIATKMHLSISQLNRKLNKIIHQPAGQLIRDMRMKYAAQLLISNAASVGDIAYEVGYVNPSHFCRSFKRHFGCAPSAYFKNKDKNM